MSEQMLQGDQSKLPARAAEQEERHQGDPARMVASASREMADPTDGFAPTPVWLLLLFFGLAMWSGYYLSRFGGGFKSDDYNENATIQGAAAQPPKPVDPLVLGQQTFNVCVQCHQETGLGVAGAFPPLAGSPIVRGDPATLVRILLHGLQGDVMVLGATYNGQMPNWEHLGDDQIAAVLTYIRSTWGNSSPPVDPGLVMTLRKDTTAHSQPWTWAELTAEAAKGPPIAASPVTAKPVAAPASGKK